MKRLLLLLPLILLCHLLHGQCIPILHLNLDTGNVSKLQLAHYYYPLSNDSFPNFINIDTANFHRNQWQIGRPQKAKFDSAHSYPNAIVTDTLHPCIPNDTSAFVMSVPILIFGICHMTFYYKLDIDSGDIALIESSIDGGHTWDNIFSVSSGFDFPNGRPNFASSTVGWDTLVIANFIPFFYIRYPLLRFTFITDSNTSPRAGWMIDDFQFDTRFEGVEQVTNNYFLNAYPNPTSTELTITSSHRITDIAVTSLVGQAVYRKPCNATEVTVDVSNLPVGVYLVRINGIEVRRFVKE